jgi:hypothetical protein
MIISRQSTARTVIVGPVLDADGVAVTDGVVADFKLSKNGAAPAALDGSATLTHRHTGFYSLALTASDLDTVGQAEVAIDDTVNACPMKVLTIIEEAVYDALFAAAAAGYATQAAASAIETDTQDIQSRLPAALVGGRMDSSIGAMVANVLSAAALAADAAQEIAAAVEVAILNEGDLSAVLEAIRVKIETSDDDLTTSLIRDAILDRSLAGNHDTNGTVGKFLQNIDALVSSRMATFTPIDAAGVRSAVGLGSANLDTQLASIVTTQGSHTTSLTSLSGVIVTKLNTMLVLDGSVYQFTANALDNAPSGGGGSGLDGPSSVTLTFEDADGDPVPLVDFTIVGQGPGRADTDGVAAFGLEDGTYTVVARPTTGTLFANEELVVDGSTAMTITGTAVAITPASSPAQTTAYTYTRNGGGTLTSGVTVYVALKDPNGSVDAWLRNSLSDTSGGDFLCEFTLAKGGTYRHRVGQSGPWSEEWTIPIGAGSTYAMPEVMGANAG